MTTIKVELDEDVALALAQFVKRVGFRELRVNAANEDEAYKIRTGIYAVMEGLAEGGFSPR